MGFAETGIWAMMAWQQQAANRWGGFILRWKYIDQWQIVSIENGNEDEEPARCMGRYYDYSTFFSHAISWFGDLQTHEAFW
jgi:hypothetical protein